MKFHFVTSHRAVPVSVPGILVKETTNDEEYLDF
jgi:hypothetical protein